MIKNKITPLILVVTLLTACSSDSQEGEKIGTAAGAVVGGVLGSNMGSGDGRTLGAGLGAIFGAWLGRIMGKTLDEMDQQQANETAQETMETAEVGQTSTWSNPDLGNSGTYTPTSETDEQECRDFESTVIIDGREEQASGRACRQEDGTWKIVE